MRFFFWCGIIALAMWKSRERREKMNHYFRKKKWTYGLYLVFVPLSCMASILFALSFQPVIDTALSGDLPAFVRASLGCIFVGRFGCTGISNSQPDKIQDTSIGKNQFKRRFVPFYSFV